jgi:hypothetical protein
VSVVNSKPVPELCKCLASLQHPHQHHGDSLQVSGQSGVMGWPRFLPTSVRFLQWELWTPCSLPCAPAMGTGPLVANTWTRDHSTLQITGPGWKKLSNASCFVDSPSHGEVVLFGKEELEGQEDQGSPRGVKKLIRKISSGTHLDGHRPGQVRDCFTSLQTQDLATFLILFYG